MRCFGKNDFFKQEKNVISLSPITMSQKFREIPDQ